MERKRERKRGTTLMELVGVLAIIVVIMGIGGAAVAKNMDKTHMTLAISSLKAYEEAFQSAVAAHPGIMKDREAAWGTSGEKYTTKLALSRVVEGINAKVDKESQLEWDEELKHYVSHAEDPWGGRYVLTEYPTMPTEILNLFDPKGAGKSAMRVAIWSTGKQELGEATEQITDKYIGVALEYVGGEVSATYHGTDNEFPYTGGTIKNI